MNCKREHPLLPNCSIFMENFWGKLEKKNEYVFFTWFVTKSIPPLKLQTLKQKMWICPDKKGSKWELCWTNWATSWQNQQNSMCTEQWLRSAWASAQSALSTWRKLGSLATHWATAKSRSDLADAGFLLGAQSFCWLCHAAAQMLNWCGCNGCRSVS